MITIDEAINQLMVSMKDKSLEDKIVAYNKTTMALKQCLGMEHPVLAPQLVKAIEVKANEYNPNKVAPPEMRLLEISIKKDGMTMPVVVSDDLIQGNGYVVVDGFHRTSIIQRNKEINRSLMGYLPVVKLNKTIEDRITATVRHNMARGSHVTELSAKLVTALKKHNWTDAKIGLELGMDPDEVLRLKQQTGLAEAFSDKSFSMAWE